MLLLLLCSSFAVSTHVVAAAAAVVVQFPRPEYVAADLSKVKLADALATTSFNPKEPALFTIGESRLPQDRGCSMKIHQV